MVAFIEGFHCITINVGEMLYLFAAIKSLARVSATGFESKMPVSCILSGCGRLKLCKSMLKDVFK